MKKKLVFCFIMLFIALFGLDFVYADTFNLYTDIEGGNNKFRVNDEFIYNIGIISGCTSKGCYSDKIDVSINYDPEIVQIIEVDGKKATATNDWDITYIHDSGSGLTVNSSTDDVTKMYNSGSNIKIISVKFKVIHPFDTFALRTDLREHIIASDGSDLYSSRYNKDDIIYGYMDSNNDLMNLALDNGNLMPSFEATTLSYTANVDYEIDNININAECAGYKCKIAGLGNKQLNIGKNNFEITVQAQDGSTKTYNLEVIRLEERKCFLTQLEIDGIDLNFNSEITEYTINVPSDTTKLNIHYKSNNDKDNNVIIEGNENLKSGNNKITITVKNEENNLEKVYKINAVKDKSNKENSQINSSDNDVNHKNQVILPMIIIFSFLFVIIGIIIFVVIKRKKKENSNSNNIPNKDDGGN